MPAETATTARPDAARHISLRFVVGLGVSLILHGLVLGLLLRHPLFELPSGGAGEAALMVEWQPAPTVPKPVPEPVRLPETERVVASHPATAATAAVPEPESPAATAPEPAGDGDLTAIESANASSTTVSDPAPPAGADGGTALDAYAWDVLAHLRRFQQYPEAARRRGIEGTVWLSARVSRKGDVLQAEVAQSSGSDLLDRAAARLIVMASPLPPPPDAAFAITDLRLPVAYTLERP